MPYTYNPYITVMLIDDDEDDRNLFQEGLTAVDPSVKLVNASGGMDAFLKLKEDPTILPDFIFLDLNMPVMDGHEVLAGLKNDELLKNIPVIIYTTSYSKKEKEETIKHGAVSWITKPNSIEELQKIIARMLSLYKGL
jgi:CheY-like chemotaxis protein